MINVAREAMLAIGCIQAQRCHTGHCPTGVATQNHWLMRGLDRRQGGAPGELRHDPAQGDAAARRACGVEHPRPRLDHFEIVDDRFGERSAREVFGYETAPRPPRAWREPDPDQDIVTVHFKPQSRRPV